MNTTPLWTDQYPRPDDLPISSDLPSEVDVVVVGSGYTGLNAARVLAKFGMSVAVFERNSMGWGASSRNGGMATPGLKQGMSNIYKKYGAEIGREFWKASVDAIDLIENIVNENNIDCDWARVGHVALASKKSHVTELESYANWIGKEFGHKKRIISRDQIKDEIGSEYYYGAISDEISAGIHPAKYVFGLVRAVGNLGVSLFEKTNVESIENKVPGFHVITSRGDLKAKEVVMATNGYTDSTLPGLKPKVISVGSYIIVTEPLSKDLQDELSPKRRMYYDSKWFINYFRLTPDGRMLWGGRNDLSVDLDLKESSIILGKEMRTVFPQLEGVPITHSWSGQLGVTFDLMPHIGKVNNVWYGNGYSGHGLSIATYLGTELGLLISGQKERSPFQEITHQTMFFYRNKPWFLPMASRYYRLLDWLS